MFFSETAEIHAPNYFMSDDVAGRLDEDGPTRLPYPPANTGRKPASLRIRAMVSR